METKTLDEMAKEFENAQKNYFTARENEAKKIIKFLKGKCDNVKINNAEGKFEEFTGTIPNKKWIVVETDNNIISLQPFDIDCGTKNYHVLLDRLGWYYKDENDKSDFLKIKGINIDLPIINLGANNPFCDAEKFINEQWKYDKSREKQRDYIIKLLNDSANEKNIEINISNRGSSGRGSRGYISARHLKKPYNLYNWKWISVQDKYANKEILISLQRFNNEILRSVHKRLGNQKVIINNFKKDMVYKEFIIRPFVTYDKIGFIDYSDKCPIMESAKINLPICSNNIEDLKIFLDDIVNRLK